MFVNRAPGLMLIPVTKTIVYDNLGEGC